LCWFLLGAAIYTRLQVVWFGAYVQPNNIYLTALFNWFVSLFFTFNLLLLFLPPTAFYMEGPWAATATTCIFLAAAVTDWLDGYIARKVCRKYYLNNMLDWVAVPVFFYSFYVS
jgi:phosphatidylglycerophosphate synthase